MPPSFLYHHTTILPLSHNPQEGTCRLTGLGYQPVDSSKKCVKVDVTGMNWSALSGAEKEKLILKGLNERLIGGMKDDVNVISSRNENEDDVEVVNSSFAKKEKETEEDKQQSTNVDDWTPVSMCLEVCSNIKALEFELASTCSELVQSFNINTNRWMSRWVGVALGVLVVWLMVY